MNSVKIMSVPVHQVTRIEALARINEFIRSKQPHLVTTVNNEFILEARRNPQFLEALQSSDLSLADSTGVVWASRRFKGRLPERVAGADLVDDLVKLAADQGWSIFLVGGADGVAQKAKTKLIQRLPAIKIVGAEIGLKPGDGKAKAEALVSRIKKAKPDILLVAFGAPKQELFINRYKKALGVPVMIGVGGTLDFIAGRIKRAPKIVRKLGLEWLWRLILQPSRLPRIWRAVIVFPIRVAIGR